MKSRAVVFAAAFSCCAALASAQAPLKLQINGGRVTLHAENVPVRSILAEWARLGGTKIVNGDRVSGAPLTLELEGVPERQALDIILRGVSGYALAARTDGTPGVSMYDRIMILPTSVAPRNPPPAAATQVFGGPGGIIRPPVMRQGDDQDDPDDDQVGANDGVPLGRPVPMPRPIIGGVPFGAPVVQGGVMPPIAVLPPDADQPQPQQPPSGVVPTPTNPFGLPAGSSTRPGVITPVAPTPPGMVPLPPGGRPQE
jgi:hypothetical protein